MENTNTFKVQSTSSNLISLNVTPGHYATSSSHINYYIDMTSLKSRRSEAHAAAKVLAAATLLQRSLIRSSVWTVQM